MTCNWLIRRHGGADRKDSSGAQADGSPQAIVLGSVLDGVPESFVLGLTVLQGGISVALLTGVVLSNLPEGLSSSAGLRVAGWARRRVVVMWLIVVAVSGTVRASIGLVGWQNLWSPYGVLVLVKVVALLAMGLLGAWYRRRLIGRMADEAGSRLFWGVIALELALSVVLLAGAGLVARSFWSLQQVSLGFNPDQLAMAELTVSLPLRLWKFARISLLLRSAPWTIVVLNVEFFVR